MDSKMQKSGKYHRLFDRRDFSLASWNRCHSYLWQIDIVDFGVVGSK